jgi:DtxR family transcriptional regulator, Mn-dependent transcriptional regulator
VTSPAVEDYLKAIWLLSQGGDAAATSAIAERLGVAAASVTGMLKRLADQGLVAHERYHGARLTAAGEAKALGMVRRHRVLELFLVEVLGYRWDQVHAEAERLEHAASDELVDRMARVLGEPDADPHGHPIPARGAPHPERRFPTLAQLDAGRDAVLRRVSDDDPDALRQLARLGLTPGARLRVLARHDLGLRIRVHDLADETLPHLLAELLQVEPLDG